jgi:hypothetical protein
MCAWFCGQSDARTCTSLLECLVSVQAFWACRAEGYGARHQAFYDPTVSRAQVRFPLGSATSFESDGRIFLMQRHDEVCHVMHLSSLACLFVQRVSDMQEYDTFVL